ncbi:MAG: Rrf2 family transcriptional regulator [Patescibacteria group bacterium]
MFGLSTKGEYGLSLLESLAYEPTTVVSLKKIAKAKKLPIKYLERLASSLKRAGLIKSKEGAKGGYYLAKPIAQIKLIDVIKILEGDLAPTICTGDHLKCPRQDTCTMKQGWLGVRNKIYFILSSYTLADLFKNNN